MIKEYLYDLSTSTATPSLDSLLEPNDSAEKLK